MRFRRVYASVPPERDQSRIVKVGKVYGNRVLESIVEIGNLRGGFREDLYYRLNVVTLRIPPLRERLVHLLCHGSIPGDGLRACGSAGA